MTRLKKKFPKDLILCSLLLLWTLSIFSQESNYEGPIIDMHVHAYQEANPSFGQTMRHPLTGISYPMVADLNTHKAWTFEKFREHRIVKAVVNYHPGWHEEDPDRILLALGSGDPDSLQILFEAGKIHVMAEMAQYYNGAQADDPALDAYFEVAESSGIPVGYHIFPGGPPGGKYTGYPGVRAANADPMQIEAVLVAHPNLKLYIMHAGWPYLEDMKALMYAHPQVYVDLGVISWSLPVAEFHNYLKGLVDAGFGDRILYGTDQMIFKGSFDQAIRNVNSASFLSLEQKEAIFFGNAATFLELSEAEVRRLKTVR